MDGMASTVLRTLETIFYYTRLEMTRVCRSLFWVMQGVMRYLGRSTVDRQCLALISLDTQMNGRFGCNPIASGTSLKTFTL